MCAIAGQLSISLVEQIARQEVFCALNKMKSRGPDFSDVWTDNFCILGSCRLSIVNLENSANQPITSTSGETVLCFNGEIYNWRTLAKEFGLPELGDSFVLVNLFERLGESVLDRLDGMFAFAAYTKANKTIFLARDRFGTKPLFFCVSQNSLVFASDLDAIFTFSAAPKKELSPAGRDQYLTLMAAQAPQTVYKNVYSLPAGFSLEARVNSGELLWHTTRWFILAKEVGKCAKNLNKIDWVEAKKSTEALLRNSIFTRLDCDQDSAIFLSGGLDSSTIAAIGGSKIKKAFFAKLEGQASEEGRARTVAKILNLELQEVYLTKKDQNDLAEEMFEQISNPIADIVTLPFLALSRAANKNGFRVVLIGEGADEIFGGYSWYAKYQRLERLYKFWPARAAIDLGVKFGLLKNPVFKRIEKGQPPFLTSGLAWSPDEIEVANKIFQQLSNSSSCEAEFDSVAEKIWPQFGNAGVIGRIKSLNKEADGYFGDCGFFTKAAIVELQTRIPNLLMSRVDQPSMAYSVEAREPFLDHHLVEFVLGLPEKIRLLNSFQGSKPLLRSIALKYFDRSFVDAPKVGFSTPHRNLNCLNNKSLRELKDTSSVRAWTAVSLAKFLIR